MSRAGFRQGDMMPPASGDRPREVVPGREARRATLHLAPLVGHERS
jgi:hypothetical protein